MAKGLRIIEGGRSGLDVRQAVTDLLDDCELLCLATSTGTAGPHVATLYFAHEAFAVWFVSSRDTEHGRQVQMNPRVAAAVFVPCAYGEGLRGLQLAGTVRRARPAEAADGLGVYETRFPAFAVPSAERDQLLAGQAQQTLFRFEVDAVTLVDEPRFGPGRHRALVVR
ncbi:MAG: hypothetical protein HOV79_25345 [Hamadaea sp.]|nr:hypothetical protein [Hamadaea sp.]